MTRPDSTHYRRNKASRWRRKRRSTKEYEIGSSTKSHSALRRAPTQKPGLWRSTIHMLRPRGDGSSSGGVVTAQAPAGQAAAGRAARRQTVATATTPDLGAAPTPILRTSGRIPRPNPSKLSTTAGMRELQAPSLFSECHPLVPIRPLLPS